MNLLFVLVFVQDGQMKSFQKGTYRFNKTFLLMKSTLMFKILKYKVSLTQIDILLEKAHFVKKYRYKSKTYS